MILVEILKPVVLCRGHSLGVKRKWRVLHWKEIWIGSPWLKCQQKEEDVLRLLVPAQALGLECLKTNSPHLENLSVHLQNWPQVCSASQKDHSHVDFRNESSIMGLILCNLPYLCYVYLHTTIYNQLYFLSPLFLRYHEYFYTVRARQMTR